MNRFLLVGMFREIFFDQIEDQTADFEFNALVFLAVAVREHMKAQNGRGNVGGKRFPLVLERSQAEQKDEKNHGEKSRKIEMGGAK